MFHYWKQNKQTALPGPGSELSWQGVAKQRLNADGHTPQSLEATLVNEQAGKTSSFNTKKSKRSCRRQSMISRDAHWFSAAGKAKLGTRGKSRGQSRLI